MEGKCIVICAGDLTLGEIPVGEEDLVIAVDGGLDYCAVLNVEPDLILGDFDSLSEEEYAAVEQLEQQIPERVIRLQREKDETDGLAALQEGLKRGYTEFRIYAGTGGRFDHTLANIQCLIYLKNRGANGYLVDGMGMMLVIKDEAIHFKRNLKGTLSLFSMVEESKGVTIRGMKYELDCASVRNDFPLGISNEFIGQEAEILVEDGTLVCMLQYAD